MFNDSKTNRGFIRTLKKVAFCNLCFSNLKKIISFDFRIYSQNFSKQKITSPSLVSGLALSELLVSVALVAIISVFVGYFQRDVFYFASFGRQGIDAQLGARKILKPITTEIRSASPSSLGAYPIAEAQDFSFIFFSDTDSDGLKERIRYFTEDGQFKRGVTIPSGVPLVYDTLTETITILIEHVVNEVNEPVFEYFDSSYNGSTNPLSTPVSIPDVRLVKIEVHIDQDPNRPPAEMVVTTQSTIRNLKDNL